MGVVLGFKGWEGYNISEWRQGASLLATGKLIKFLQALAGKAKGWSANRARVLCSARGNIVIKICTSTLHFPRTVPPACRGMIYASKDAVLSVSTVSKLHPITVRSRLTRRAMLLPACWPNHHGNHGRFIVESILKSAALHTGGRTGNYTRFNETCRYRKTKVCLELIR